MQTEPLREFDPQERVKTLPVIKSETLAKKKREAAQVHRNTEELRDKIAQYDAEALARWEAEFAHESVAGSQGDPNETQPMMPVVESHLTELDRALGEAKGMEERLKSAGIDPDALAAGKVGLWKRMTHSQIIHDWEEANKAVAELGPKGGVNRSAEQRAGRRARMMTPPKAPRSPFGLG